jgi:hypothetical protein
MALNTKRFLVLDPIVWPVLPPKPGFYNMPAHQAKEGALLLLEAGAPAYPALVRIAETGGGFRMEHAIELSEARAVAVEKSKASAERKARVERGELVVIEPIAKVSEAERLRALEEEERKARLQLSRFPVRVRDSVAALILTIMVARKTPVQFSSQFCQEVGLWRSGGVSKIVATASTLEDQGLVVRLTRGNRASPSQWELTELGRANAEALKGGSHAGEA